jgi:hypothetical protein
MRLVQTLKERRLARRWQHWTEVEPIDDYGRRAGIVTAFAFLLFALIVALVVVGLVVAR